MSGWALRPYQQDCHDAAIAHMAKSVSPFCIAAATGCHAWGHPILMHDGRVKPVQDIVVGDMVMGPDSRPREVTDLHRGVSQLVDVAPVKGEPFTVNSGHVFSMYVTPQKAGMRPGYDECTADEFISGSATYQHIRKLQRCSVEFPRKKLPVPPWVVGVMLGDGGMTQLTPSLCTPDIEVKDEIRQWAESVGCGIGGTWRGGAWHFSISDNMANRSNENRARKALKEAGVYWSRAGTKQIPFVYKTSGREQRLDLLAGLIDTDGSLSRKGYDWISKSEQLADDMVFLSRSLGLAAYKMECTKSCQGGFSGTYYRVSISGDCSSIPCRVTKKRSQGRMQKKRVDVTGLRMSRGGVGLYYGFSLSGDHLYLDGHFVRHHNSGKSLIVAEIARTIHSRTGKRVLCLAPSAELVRQNYSKYLATGNPASMFSASAGAKDLRHAVVFGSPLTVKNRISSFQKPGAGGYALIVLDECHQITPTVRRIIEAMREGNPNLRVCGLTATPYRMGTGYIFGQWPDGRANDEGSCRDPYFTHCVAEIGARSLIDGGYLTPPVISEINAEGYDTGALTPNSMGRFDAGEADRAYHGHGRKTAAIVGDIVEKSRDRRGALIFAATVHHAREVMSSLPPGLSAMVTGETPRKERDRMLKEFLAGRIKYMVNVSVLTIGFDAPHVDVVAIMRKTESVGLLQQIIGRGLRLCEGKRDCLVLDYTTNIEDHCPDGDIFSPKVRAGKPPGEGRVRVVCPDCQTVNEVSPNGEYEDYEHDEAGYILDLEGKHVMSEYGPIAMHYGRRCMGMVRAGALGEYVRCSYRWTSKECPHCFSPNDIAARRCSECKGEIVDPNEKLAADFKAMKRDPYRTQTDGVISMTTKPGVSQAGNKTLRVEWITPYRQLTTWLMPEARHTRGQAEWELFSKATNGGETQPMTITYKKDKESGFFRVLAYNMVPDAAPAPEVAEGFRHAS